MPCRKRDGLPGDRAVRAAVRRGAEGALQAGGRDPLGPRDAVAGQRARRRGGQLDRRADGVVDPGRDAHRASLLPGPGGPSCPFWNCGGVYRLSFTTVVAAPLTVAFDVARALGRPRPVPLAGGGAAAPGVAVDARG